MSTTTVPPSPEPQAPTPPAAPDGPHRAGAGALDPKMLLTSLPDAVRKLDPRVMVRSPVMFVEIGRASCRERVSLLV